MFISTLKTTHSLLRRQLRWGGLGHEHRPFLTPLPSRVFPSVSSSVLFFPTPLPLHVRTSSMRPFSSLKINTHPLRSNGKGTPFLKDFKRRWVWTVVGIAGGGSMVVIWGVGLYMGWVGTNNTLHDDPSLTSTWWYTSGLKENLRAMYAHKSTWELGRTWVLMELMQHSGFMETLLKVSPEWVTWGLTWVPGLTHFMKFTWFNQFCGGENEMEMKVTLRKLAHTFSSSTLASTSTLIPIIDIANEDVGEMDLDTHTSNSSFEALQPWILSALRLAKDHQTEFKQPVMLALKGSALMDMPRLQQLAGTVETGMGLVDKGQDQDQTKEARVRVGSTSSPEWTELMRRFTWVVDQAKQQKVPVMVDAETSDIQPVLDQVYLELAQRFNPKYDHENHTDPVWVYQTYQMYLKNGLEKLQHDHQWCLAHGVKLGVKLVRGAYLHWERQRAASLHLPDPLQPTLEATHRQYAEALDYLIHHHVPTLAATHNLASIRSVLDVPQVQCAQLYGMMDGVAWILHAHHKDGYKYIPYGPLQWMVPYLIRRAQENHAMLKDGASMDRLLLRHELASRFQEWVTEWFPWMSSIKKENKAP